MIWSNYSGSRLRRSTFPGSIRVKASLNQTIRTLMDVPSEWSGRIIPSGSVGRIVACYDHPEAYAVDIAFAAPDVAGGVAYENLLLIPGLFEIVEAEERTA